MLSDAEQRIFDRVCKHFHEYVSTTLTTTVKDNIQPTLVDLMQQEDSVFDTTTLSVKTPTSPQLNKKISQSFTEYNTKIVEIEETLTSIVNRQKEICRLLDDCDNTLISRVGTMESTITTLVKPKLDTFDSHIASYRKDRKMICDSFADVRKDMTSLQDSIAQNTALIYATNSKINACEELCDQICSFLDNLGQYTRRESLEFHGIPDLSKRGQPENTTRLIINFCKYYLDIHVTKFDISVSHRQPIEADRQKFKEKYIAPIYCRFVNRHLANDIVGKRRMLKDARNSRNGRFYIKENLTLQRRLLRDRARAELPLPVG